MARSPIRRARSDLGHMAELSDVSLGLSLSFASQRCTVCSYVSTRRSQYVYSWLRKKKDTRDHDMHSIAVCDTKMFDVMLRSS